MYKVLIVDDHFVVREGLKLVLETGERFEVAGEASNGEEALRLIEETAPDVILMDLNMPVMSGLEAMKRLKERECRIPVIILTTYNEDELMMQGLALGAKGYLLKDTNSENLFRSIESAARGEMLLSGSVMERMIALQSKPSDPPPQESKIMLTDKEAFILESVAQGYTSKRIALDMAVSERTIKSHLTNVYNKLGVDSRSQAVAVALERGLIQI
ncbi:response regulator [Saccharibacillus alkalitolerans]|uniref:Response regulator transcription factor n=1 Tax=Saccharibacillus alkalitolerans TaxID=2705290 RepID=A0ABX0F8L6_9BACL|nr:response regulator transcription factor [Saccharibacillus alkalitolerans]NGZ77207.1 response regulator transcription factor [Saccharibacillus alkalitolerans]